MCESEGQLEMSATETNEQLSFEDDKGASRSAGLAPALLIALVAWMGSTYILPPTDADARERDATAAPRDGGD